MNRVQTAASLALWKARETKRYAEWQRLKKKNASTKQGGKRDLAYKDWNLAHAMRVRRQIELSKMQINGVSEAGAEHIADREGVVPYAYRDSRGFPTAWVGHLIQAKDRPITQAEYKQWGSKQHPVTKRECLKFFRGHELLPFEKVVTDANNLRIKRGHKGISQQQFDACVSLAFNIGTGGFATSTVARMIANGSPAADVARAFMLWDQPPEIVGRRKSEANQYKEG